jgi:hypothetical protein
MPRLFVSSTPKVRDISCLSLVSLEELLRIRALVSV